MRCYLWNLGKQVVLQINFRLGSLSGVSQSPVSSGNIQSDLHLPGSEVPPCQVLESQTFLSTGSLHMLSFYVPFMYTSAWNTPQLPQLLAQLGPLLPRPFCLMAFISRQFCVVLKLKPAILLEAEICRVSGQTHFAQPHSASPVQYLTNEWLAILAPNHFLSF